MNLEYDNYVFDLYGTLIDIHTDEHAAQTWKKWLRVLDKRGIKHPHYIQFRKEFFAADLVARKIALEKGTYEVPEIDIIPVYRELFRKYGNPELSDEELDEISYAFRTSSWQYIRLFPGVKEFLQNLRENGKKIYLLSNAQASYTRPELTMFGLDALFDDILLSSDYGCMKPDPAYFRCLMDRYQMDPKKTCMHGDSASSDIAGANRVGIAWVHLVEENDPKQYYTNQIEEQ